MSNFLISKKLFFTYFTLFLLLSIKETLQQKNDSSLVLYLNEIGIKSLEKNILPSIFNSTAIPIPAPGAFETDVDFIGKLKLNITKLSLKFQEIDDDQLNLNFNEPNALSLKINNISGSLNFTYVFNSGFYNSENTGSIIFTSLGVDVLSNITTVINKNNAGKLGPNLQIESLNVQDDPKLFINFNSEGRLEALIKFFFDLISTSISETIIQKVKSTNLTDINTQISNYASNLQLKGSSSNITVDYSLNSAPVINNKILELAFDTNLTSDKDNFTYVGEKYTVPHLFDKDAPVYGIFNQYLLDGIFTLMQRDGKLNGYVLAETVQSDYFNLDVNGVSAFFSSITKYYKSSDKVDLDINCTAPPKIEFKNKKLKGNFNLTIDFLVRQSEKKEEKVSAVKADFLIIADLDFTIENADLKVKIKSLQVDKMEILSSTIGDLDAKKIISSINFKINVILFAKSSFDIDLSIYLPKIAGISFNQTSIVPHDGYLEFGVIPNEKKLLKKDSIFDKVIGKISEIKDNLNLNLKKEKDEEDLKFLH